MAVMTRGNELYSAATVYSAALARPAPRDELRRHLEQLRAALGAHITATEDGLYPELLLEAPHLARTVDALKAAHALFRRALAAMTVHDDPGDLLRDLHGHQRREAKLLHMAYNIDLGGET